MLLESDFEAVLIDLDRSDVVDERPHFGRYSGSVMYDDLPEAFTNAMLDWRQLGILLYFCSKDIDGANYHNMKLEEMRGNDYIDRLLNGIDLYRS